LESGPGPVSSGDIVDRLRVALGHPHDEELLLVLNDLFVGVVRESARMPAADLRQKSLQYLLRQSVVAACSALDAYLPLLLRTHLPTIIRVRQREFIPTDREARAFFGEFRLDIAAVLRLMSEPEPEIFLGSLILSHVRTKNFSHRSGLHIAGALLGLEQPWDQIAARLERPTNELQGRIEAVVKRRNDIVHRADRSDLEPDGPAQEIYLSWTTSHVNTVRDVAMALDELVEQRIHEYEALAPSGEAVTA
jgi:hypothetical protein